MNNLKFDCRYFNGDRPCKPHKQTGVVCGNCDLYKPVNFKVLIVKLDALGDVLRTTSVLHSLTEKYPAAYITWLTKKNASELFINNSLVDEVFTLEDPSTMIKLAVTEYDLVLNLDPSPVSSSIASYSKGKIKKGFGLNEKGKVFPFNREAVEWFEMGAFDNLKKQNKKSYQQIIHEISGLNFNGGEIIINLSNAEKEFKNQFIDKNGLKKYKFIIGLNAGASERWQFKKWHIEGYAELIKKLTANLNCAVLLYGGEDEKETNERLRKISDNVIDTGCDNSLREFFALVDISDVFITGDTLALHAATALKKNVICLFGPTSHNEIYDYGRIEKIIPGLDCLVCYKNRCDFRPNCMEIISVDMVYEAVLKQLKNKK